MVRGMQLHAATRRHRVAPFVGICALALTATLLRTAGTSWLLVSYAAALAAGLTVLGLLSSRVRRLAPILLVLPFSVDLVLAMLRQAQGGSTSGYAPLAVLPVIWVGLTRGRRAVALVWASTTLMFAVPLLVVGAPDYPSTGWRSVVLWSVVALLVGSGARIVVAEQQRLATLSDERARGLDRLVDAQSAISADGMAPAVMTTVAVQALAVVGGDAACVEIVAGDEAVCAAVAGTAEPFFGLRVPLDQSITGECFRTRKVLICEDTETDGRVEREACRQVGARSMILVPLIHGDDAKGVLIVWSATAGAYRDYEAQLLAMLAGTSAAALVRAELIVELTAQAVTDELTGLANRRAWNERLEHAIARSRRTGAALSVVALDVDGLKQVNDAEGHAAGDALLVGVSAAWSGALRATDTLGRLGGDEFAAILEGADAAYAGEVVRRLRDATPPPFRASAGIAAWDGHEDASSLLARADAAMYEHKMERRGATG
jgi:diguanylate cyclase (GGDEF)-like protein